MGYEYDNRFPIKLKMLRLEMGLSQEKFALRVGLSRSCLANYETGNRQPDMKTIEAIANRCGVAVSLLAEETSYAECEFCESDKKKSSGLKTMIQSRGNTLDISHLPPEYKICMIEYYNYVCSKYQKNKK